MTEHGGATLAAERVIAATPSKICLPRQAQWGKLVDFLSQQFSHVSRMDWAVRFEGGRITDAQTHEVLSLDTPFTPGRWIHYYREVLVEKEVPQFVLDDIRIVHEDEHLLIVDKPHFLPVVPSGAYITKTLLHQLRVRTGIDSLSPAHRLDRDTAGLVVLTKQASHRAAYQRLFQQRQVEKTYLAIAPWNSELFPTCPSESIEYQSHLARSPAHFMQQMERTDNAPNAITILQCLGLIEPHHEQYQNAVAAKPLAIYKLLPVTGQRHQLRAHMNALGMPIIGDGIYPQLSPEGDIDWTQPLCLLAQSIRFKDPLTEQWIQANCQRELNARLDQDPHKLAVLNKSTP